MKSSSVISSVLIASTTSSLAAAQCGYRCIGNAITNNGDYCSNSTAIDDINSCVAATSCSDSDKTNVYRAVAQICADIGVDVTATPEATLSVTSQAPSLVSAGPPVTPRPFSKITTTPTPTVTDTTLVTSTSTNYWEGCPTSTSAHFWGGCPPHIPLSSYSNYPFTSLTIIPTSVTALPTPFPSHSFSTYDYSSLSFRSGPVSGPPWGPFSSTGAWTTGPWTSWWGSHGHCPPAAWNGWTSGSWSVIAPWTTWTGCDMSTTGTSVITTTVSGTAVISTSYGIRVVEATSTAASSSSTAAAAASTSTAQTTVTTTAASSSNSAASTVSASITPASSGGSVPIMEAADGLLAALVALLVGAMAL